LGSIIYDIFKNRQTIGKKSVKKTAKKPVKKAAVKKKKK
jgi:hypothetical protein